jgi:hypothetical protein
MALAMSMNTPSSTSSASTSTSKSPRKSVQRSSTLSNALRRRSNDDDATSPRAVCVRDMGDDGAMTMCHQTVEVQSVRGETKARPTAAVRCACARM